MSQASFLPEALHLQTLNSSRLEFAAKRSLPREAAPAMLVERLATFERLTRS